LRRQAEWIDAFMVTSARYADSMIDYLGVAPERIFQIVQGIECQQYPAERPPRDSSEFVIGYRAQVCPKLGLHVLGEAFCALKKRTATPRIRLKVAGYLGAGEKRYFQKIVQSIERAGYSADFEYVGELEPEAQGSFFSGLDAVAAPVVYPDQVAMVVPQALACGVPVVAARLGALPEWIESTGGGVLVEPDDSESFAEGLMGLIESPDRARELGRAGQEAVRSRHDILHMADDVLEVAQQFVAPKSGSDGSLPSR
jgi:glycosyltransferase involved in cell wall biosynthesis